MTKEKNKFKEIILGILTGIAMLVIGHLMSGRLSFVEDIKLYETWFLVFAFPLLFCFFSIWLAKYAAKKRTSAYLTAFFITFFIPVVASVAFFILLPFDNGEYSNIAELFAVPALSIFFKMRECLDDIGLNELASSITIAIVNLVPMIAGLVRSVILYRKTSALGS